jgi:uncharacterized protein (DUF983 family)
VQSPDVIRMIFVGLMIANVMMFLSQTFLLRFVARIITVPKYLLLPIVAVFCVIGTYIANNTMFNNVNKEMQPWLHSKPIRIFATYVISIFQSSKSSGEEGEDGPLVRRTKLFPENHRVDKKVVKLGTT